MGLARDWTRRLCGAWGAAVLAPVTMIAALAVLVLGGGFGGLSALGQVFSGPGVPVGPAPAGARAAHRSASRLLPVVPAAAPARAAATVLAATPAAAGRSGGSAGGGSPAGRSRGGGGTTQRIGSGGHGVAPPPPTLTTPTQPAPPVHAPAPSPGSPVTTVVNKVLAVGENVTSKLPAPVAKLGTGTLQSLGQTLNTLLSPL